LQANLALAQTGGTEVSGWRGSVITFLGTGLNPQDILSNVVHGALYFFPIYIITLAAGGFWEVLFGTIRKHAISEGFLVTSLLFPLILPPNLPLWQVVLGISFGVVIGKEIFGGVGMNILNPALTGRAFLYFAYPAQISGDSVWVAVDGISRATPLAELADPLMNLSVSMKDAILGIIPGSMGETSVIACLIGAAILIISRVGSWRTMFGSVVGMVSVALLFNLVGSDTNPMFQVTPIWHFVLGGFAFGTVFMATDPVSSAHTQKGQYVYGLLIGMLTVMVRVVNMGFPEGIMLAILFANVFAPVIDKIFINKNIKRRQLRSV
jgi:Na+-transporting NADH:ubiquinone oxidoreductase subunit B